MRRNLQKHDLRPGQAFTMKLNKDQSVTAIIQHDLGAGGFGVVWKAVDPATGKEYAIKHVNVPKLLEEGKIRRDEKDLLIERIWRESRIAVPSEYVVTCYGVHEIEENFFLLNDYVPSDGNLKLWIRHNAQTAWRVKKALFLKILCGVRDLHQAGIIHRDLKPQNILLTSETKIPKIIDFGLVKLEGVDLSKSGDLSGTFAYKDPSIGGKGIKYVNRTADIYALGILLYELIVGQHPWEANGIATEEFFERIRDKDNALEIDRQFRLDAAPEEIAAVKETIRRATNFFAPEKRPQSADDMTRLLGGVPEPVRPAPQKEPAPPRVETPPEPSVDDQTDWRKKERRPFPMRRMMTLAALLAAGALGVMYFDDGMRLWHGIKGQLWPQTQPTVTPQSAISSPVVYQQGGGTMPAATATAAPKLAETPAQPTPRPSQEGKPTATPQSKSQRKTPVINTPVIAIEKAVATATTAPKLAETPAQPITRPSQEGKPTATPRLKPTVTPVPTATLTPIPTNTPMPKPTATPTPIPTPSVVELLSEANALFEKQQFLTPENRNAVSLYQEILRREPQHDEAQKQLDRIAAMYREWAETKYISEQDGDAQTYYLRYLSVAEFLETAAPDSRRAAEIAAARERLAPHIRRVEARDGDGFVIEPQEELYIVTPGERLTIAAHVANLSGAQFTIRYEAIKQAISADGAYIAGAAGEQDIITITVTDSTGHAAPPVSVSLFVKGNDSIIHSR